MPRTSHAQPILKRIAAREDRDRLFGSIHFLNGNIKKASTARVPDSRAAGMTYLLGRKDNIRAMTILAPARFALLMHDEPRALMIHAKLRPYKEKPRCLREAIKNCLPQA